VKTLTGKTITIRIDAVQLETIESVKEKIAKRVGIAADYLRLILGGRRLLDVHTTAYYNIKK
jgi:hypothetical protein